MGANIPRGRRTPAAQEPVQRGDGGEARLWHLGTALAVSFTVAVVGLAGLAWLAWVLLGVAGYRHHGAPALKDTVSVLQLVFATVAGAGALVALIVAYRRQKVAEADAVHDRTRVFNERFTAIAAQLGDDQPAVRLAGVHAMAGLADDWKQNRQTCVHVLCAYLRLPYDPEPGDDAAAAERTVYQANREVRHTIIRLIGTHLRPEAAVSWQGLSFDFNGVVFDGGDFRGAEFPSGLAVFDGAEFSAGIVRFNRAKFSGGEVYFGGAKFSGGTIRFDRAKFSGGTVSFRDIELSSGTISFDGATFAGGTVNFSGAQFCGGEVSFSDGVLFAGGTVRFDSAKFGGGTIRFGNVVFPGGAEFASGTVSFNGAVFAGGEAIFSAQFSGGEVSFSGAQFSGGEVNFSGSMDWSHPPVFSWDGQPPTGVVLPVQPSAEQRTSSSEADGR